MGGTGRAHAMQTAGEKRIELLASGPVARPRAHACARRAPTTRHVAARCSKGATSAYYYRSTRNATWLCVDDARARTVPCVETITPSSRESGRVATYAACTCMRARWFVYERWLGSCIKHHAAHGTRVSIDDQHGSVVAFSRLLYRVLALSPCSPSPVAGRVVYGSPRVPSSFALHLHAQSLPGRRVLCLAGSRSRSAYVSLRLLFPWEMREPTTT